MNDDERVRLITRLRGLMSKTVTNGCTEEEELAAAQMVGRLARDLGGASGQPAPSWAAQERDSKQYQALLERNTLEGILKSALQELALGHINTVSPPRRKIAGQPVEQIRTLDLLEPYFAMMLSLGASRMARGMVTGIIEELILDGLLPQVLAIPRGD